MIEAAEEAGWIVMIVEVDMIETKHVRDMVVLAEDEAVTMTEAAWGSLNLPGRPFTA